MGATSRQGAILTIGRLALGVLPRCSTCQGRDQQGQQSTGWFAQEVQIQKVTLPKHHSTMVVYTAKHNCCLQHRPLELRQAYAQTQASCASVQLQRPGPPSSPHPVRKLPAAVAPSSPARTLCSQAAGTCLPTFSAACAAGGRAPSFQGDPALSIRVAPIG